MTSPVAPQSRSTQQDGPPVRDVAVAPSVVRGLRREGYRLLRSDTRRVEFPSVLRVGRLDRWPAEVHACEVPRAPSPSWAAAVVESLLLDRWTPEHAHVWLTRRGGPDPEHLDETWARALAEVTHAYAVPCPALFVVTRTGWFRHPDGEGQRWERLRLVLPPE